MRPSGGWPNRCTGRGTTCRATSYLSHRIQVAGGTYAEVFAPGVDQMFYEFSNGCPRLLNLLADRVLLAAYAKEMKPVLAELVEKKAVEMAAQSYAQTIAPDDEKAAG